MRQYHLLVVTITDMFFFRPHKTEDYILRGYKIKLDKSLPVQNNYMTSRTAKKKTIITYIWIYIYVINFFHVVQAKEIP